ncbi:DUF2339 domain-containing protein [Rubricoccus marinus]|uniref:DUF2339 domain-containing protein n=1 Tax=Rubricoccus marinus TaxID=716817 RepID=A0A259U1Y7_9BACT|nr:DUF2339 domain-containing protein [Rubricoccus marinus]OZC03960.1 hypothetical protein BSZ36_13795 [Rubricoccus marinus]
MPDPDLQARLDALEARVADLEARLSRRPSRASGEARPARQRPAAPPGLRVKWAEAKSEDVLGKVGIALFLVGVLFLLKEAVDRGWLTAAVRVGGAGALGAALVAVGLRLRRQRPVLGRLLTGGGIATLYGALWTASALYPLLPASVALAGMAGVAVFSLVLASREDDAALSVVGTLGALMTPLLLYREGGQMALLMGYLAVVMIGAGVVYWRKGWAALVGAASGGGWGVVLVAWIVGIWPAMVEATGTDRLAFTLGAVVVWLATGILPVLRRQRLGALAEPVFEKWPSLLRPVSLAVLAAPLALIGLVDAAWTWTTPAFVGIALVLAVGYALASRAVRPLAGPLVLASAGLVAWAAGRALGIDDMRLAATLTALGCVLVWVARRDHQRDVALVGHALAMSAAFVLVVLLTFAVGFPFEQALEPLAAGQFWRVLLAAALGAGALGWTGFTSGRTTSARGFHLTAAHLVILAWLRVALGPLANGTSLTSAAWGVYGIALVVVGLRLGDDLVRSIGLGTVLVTVAKVLLIDLAQVSALSRILLFMGLGGLLLLVSYLVPSLLRGRPARGEGPGASGEPPHPPGDGLSEPPLPPVPVEREA